MWQAAPDLLDPDPDRILIAVQAHLDHALDLTGSFALSPQRVAGAAEVPGLATGDGLAQGLVVHMRDHQHVAGAGVGRHAGHEAGRVEFGLKRQPFLEVVDSCGCRHGQSSQILGEASASALAPWTGNAPAPPDCRGTCR